MNTMLLVAAMLIAAPLDELKTIKPLPVPTIPWSPPNDRLDDPADAEMIELTRIIGTMTLVAEGTKETAAVGLQIAKAAETAGGKQIRLGVLFRPWLGVSDPASDAVWAEFGKAYRQCMTLKSVIAESTYKPAAIVCTVDAESFDCRTEPKRSKCVEAYGAFDAFIRIVMGCQEVHWYSFAQVPAPATPDEWSTHGFSAPFPGMQFLGFEWYFPREAIGRRESSRRARSMATSLGVSKTSVWIAAPGSGREFRWTTAAYTEWTWDTGPETNYDTQLGRELYGAWYRNRPTRFMDPADTICVYPSPLDLRITDPERKHLLAFLKGATE